MINRIFWKQIGKARYTWKETIFRILSCKTRDHNSTKYHKVPTEDSHQFTMCYSTEISPSWVCASCGFGYWSLYSIFKSEGKTKIFQNVYLKSLIERPSKGCVFWKRKWNSEEWEVINFREYITGAYMPISMQSLTSLHDLGIRKYERIKIPRKIKA